MRISRTGRAGAPEPIETGDIHSLPEPRLASKSSLLLKPTEVALSLPPSTELPNAVAPLTDLLGPSLTVASPAWSGDPVPGMRLLQKTLLDKALHLPEDERGPLLSAIDLVERAVRMRLRWQQMRRGELEAQAGDGADGIDSEVTA